MTAVTDSGSISVTRDRARYAGVALTTTLLVIEGIAAANSYPPFALGQAILATIAGWTVGACGLLIWLDQPSRSTGRLLVVAAALWLLNAFAQMDLPAVTSVISALAWVYAATFSHALLANSQGRLSRSTAVVIAACYAAAFAPTNIAPALIGLCTALGVGLQVASGVSPRANVRFAHSAPWLLCSAWAACLIIYASVVGISVLSGPIDIRVPAQVVVIAIAIGVATDSLRRSAKQSEMTDLILDLGAGSPADIRERLAVAVGDPALKVGFWNEGIRAYVDPAGTPLGLIDARRDRTLSYVNVGDEPAVLLDVDASLAADPRVGSALRRAAELAARNASLRVRVQSQIADIERSRRRVLDVTDEERRSLRARIETSILPPIAALEDSILDAVARLPDPQRLEASQRELATVRNEILAIADGLDPTPMTRLGLVDTLRSVTAKASVPTRFELEGEELLAGLAPAVGACLYFVLSEALTNVDRHAVASLASVTVRVTWATIKLEVTDNGRGGVDARRGTGVSGLADRAETLGGSLQVVSPPAGGTKVSLVLPRVGAARATHDNEKDPAVA